MTDPVVQGWCPGAHKPMMSGDGLVVRVRPYAGEISPNQARDLASAAQEFGNGFIDLTNRANLQIRGVSDAAYPLLMEALAAADLLDEDPDIEVKRNIVITPVWNEGDESKTIYDTLVSQIHRFPEFPGKFGFVIDCGDERALANTSGDVRFEKADGGGLIVRADGCETGRLVSVETAVPAALELVEWFMANRPDHIRRLSKLLKTVELPARFSGTVPAIARPTTYGQFAPFGQLAASDLIALAEANDPIRITPWRAVIVGERVTETSSLISDPTAAILRVSACSGKPYCPQATVETCALARSLAGKWAGHLHGSGCEKGCAKPAPSDITLVGRNGRFDLVRNGAPWDDALYTNLSPADLKTLDVT